MKVTGPLSGLAHQNPPVLSLHSLHHQMNGEEAEDREYKATIRKEPVSSNDSPHPKPFLNCEMRKK